MVGWGESLYHDRLYPQRKLEVSAHRGTIGLAIFSLQNWDSNHPTFAPSIYTLFWPFTPLDQ